MVKLVPRCGSLVVRTLGTLPGRSLVRLPARAFCGKRRFLHDIRSLLHLVTWCFSEIRKWDEALVHRDACIFIFQVLYTALCTKNFQNVKSRSTIQEFFATQFCMKPVLANLNLKNCLLSARSTSAF